MVQEKAGWNDFNRADAGIDIVEADVNIRKLLRKKSKKVRIFSLTRYATYILR